MAWTEPEYQRWLNELTLDDVRALFKQHHVTEALFKRLPPNANSKNQVYLGADLGQLGKIPSGDVVTVVSSSGKPKSRSGAIFRAPLSLSWIIPGGQLEAATEAKLIAYPQYPEVRFSGFLQGCKAAPSFLFDKSRRGQDDGRVLLLGIRGDNTVVGLALPPESVAARQLAPPNQFESYGALSILPLHDQVETNALDDLLARLCALHQLGWTISQRLDGTGTLVACRSTNCNGYTLEAFLGIRSNGIAAPDFRGWEVKTRGVSDALNPGISRVTLFTPNPDGGLSATDGPRALIRTYGYPATNGTADRLNLGGVYSAGGAPHKRTGLRLILDGYDADSGAIDAEGALKLIDTSDREAASWSFRKLMDHWKTKHAHALYVPCQALAAPDPKYRFGSDILICEGGEFKLFLKAISEGKVNYDPGLKLTGDAAGNPATKVRHQIRVSSTHLGALYKTSRTMHACTKQLLQPRSPGRSRKTVSMGED